MAVVVAVAVGVAVAVVVVVVVGVVVVVAVGVAVVVVVAMTLARRTMAGAIGGMAKRFAARQFMSVPDCELEEPSDSDICDLHQDLKPCWGCMSDAADRVYDDMKERT